MSDNEYERFEISDYDLDNEFNPNRPTRRQTKHQQIYGIWADDSDNEGPDESTGRRRRRGRMGLGSTAANSKSKDYTAPVSFVAGGIHQAGKKTKSRDDKEAPEKEHPITDEDEDEDESRPGFGRGKQSSLLDAGSADSSDDSVEAESAPPKAQAKQAPPRGAVPSNRNMGAWEQHTRGIGAKLLLQMGYEPGKGLGKDLQGISQPVEAHVRKGRGAIGAYGPEAAAAATKSQNAEDVRETKEYKEKLNKWRKAGDARQDKSAKRYNYKSVEEVLEKGKKSNFILTEKISKKLGNVPVIDMTGPEKRILSGYHALCQSKIMDEDLYELESEVSKKSSTSSAPGFALPELMHNLQLIVNLCEQDIIALDTAKHDACERQLALEQERKQLGEIVKLEEDHIDTLERALALVEELTNNEELTLARAEQIFLELQQNYATEYKEFALGDLAAGVLAPLVKMALADWQPLQAPTAHVDLIKKWRSILETNVDLQTETRSNVFDPYSSLIWAGVVPSFRACAEHWEPKKHQSMAALLDCWAPLFPSWILDSVLEQLVLPRLSAGVRTWDPLTDTVPIHIWILPWNSILGHKMEEFIFPSIREKLGNALQAWMPQDRSARAMLTPWKEAFDANAMQTFLMQHIIPKLQLVLNDFIINPLQQDLEPWHQVWEWRELIPAPLMAQLLDKYFFPKWMQVLVLWLNQSPDYAEISRWYSGWKGMLSEEVLREPAIKEHLRRALEMMHRATETVPTTSPLGNIGISSTLVPPPPQPPPPPAVLLDLQVGAPAQLEFKELVSQKCAERGIIFAPLPGRREFGKQVYRIGKLFCYIDRNVCMLSDNSFQNWSPTSLQQMLEHAVTGLM